MILGVDFGITVTDVALMDGKKIAKAFGVFPNSLEKLKAALKSNGIDLRKVCGIAVTGGKRNLKSLFGKKFSRVSELDAIGHGGAFLAGLNNALIVSMGTGTCMVSFKRGKARHAAGTALGGGTIIGLSKRFLQEGNVSALKKLASHGKLHAINLSVGEAIGCGIGLAPANAPASYFAKNGRAGRADLALALQTMVAEANAIIAALAAKSLGHRKIVFVGRTPCFPSVRKTIRQVLRYYGFRPVFPKGAGHAAAIGAALAQGNCFK